MVKKIILVKPRGLCAGVERALKILDLAVKNNQGPIFYCRHEIVHNKNVVKEFEKKGVKFMEDINQIPDGATVVLSAHGTSPKLLAQAKQKNLRIIDAVCPLVTKVHWEAKRFSEAGYFVLYIGHKNHPEPEGVGGEVTNGGFKLIDSLAEAKQWQLPEKFKKLVILNQTTLSQEDTKEIIDYLMNKFKEVMLPPGSDICFATHNRQAAVKELAKKTDLILVVGSKASSNSNKLRDVGEKSGTESHLIDGPEDWEERWFIGKNNVGITAGASVPDKYVNAVVEAVKDKFGGEVQELEIIKENVTFHL